MAVAAACYLGAVAVTAAGTFIVATTAGTTAVIVAPVAAELAKDLVITGTVVLVADTTCEFGKSASKKISPVLKKGINSVGASAPPPNNGNGKKHGNDEHDNRIDEKINELKRDKTNKNIRKNQIQVDANGNKVGNNRPDVQWDDVDGNHHCYKVDHSKTNSARHGQVIIANDPKAIVELDIIK